MYVSGGVYCDCRQCWTFTPDTAFCSWYVTALASSKYLEGWRYFLHRFCQFLVMFLLLLKCRLLFFISHHPWYRWLNVMNCWILCVAIQLLKDKPPGSFVVRNSSSFQGSFGLAVKVAHLPPNVQVKGGLYWPAVNMCYSWHTFGTRYVMLVRCLSCVHISKTKQDRPIVTLEH